MFGGLGSEFCSCSATYILDQSMLTAKRHTYFLNFNLGEDRPMPFRGVDETGALADTPGSVVETAHSNPAEISLDVALYEEISVSPTLLEPWKENSDDVGIGAFLANEDASVRGE